ncbi:MULTISPECIES: DMT family transporter [unclassified Sphingobium]|uniref:DMT family transporter n=1 Tax=unclassified Sphingobium TaxID=2611147 RepID=UPI00214B6C03|nr:MULTISPECIES: DMT family transporter [unclassified Sphingobium]
MRNALILGAAGAVAPTAPTTLLCLLSTGGLLGLTTVIAGVAIRHGWHPLAFLFWSALGGGLVLAILAGLSGERPRLSLALRRYALLSGLLSFALPNMLSFAALPHVGAGFIALCLAFPPLLTYGLALPLKLDRLSVKGIAGILFGLCGAVLLATSRPAGGHTSAIWVALALIAPIIIAMGNIYRTVDWPSDTSPRLLAPAMLLTADVMVGIGAMTIHAPLVPATPRVGIVLLGAQIVIIAVTYILYFVLQRLSGPVGLSQIGWIGAATGQLLAVLWLGETVPSILPLAFLLILTGIVLVSRRAR